MPGSSRSRPRRSRSPGDPRGSAAPRSHPPTRRRGRCGPDSTRHLRVDRRIDGRGDVEALTIAERRLATGRAVPARIEREHGLAVLAERLGDSNDLRLSARRAEPVNDHHARTPSCHRAPSADRGAPRRPSRRPRAWSRSCRRGREDRAGELGAAHDEVGEPRVSAVVLQRRSVECVTRAGPRPQRPRRARPSPTRTDRRRARMRRRRRRRPPSPSLRPSPCPRARRRGQPRPGGRRRAGASGSTTTRGGRPSGGGTTGGVTVESTRPCAGSATAPATRPRPRSHSAT